MPKLLIGGVKVMILRLRTKLLIVFSVAIGGLLIFSGINIFEKVTFSNSLNRLLVLKDLAIVSNDLVHELQKERGLSAGYLGSSGQEFQNELTNQRKEVDKKISEVNKFLKALDVKIFSSEFQNSLSNALSKLNEISNVREKINYISLSSTDSFAYYTNTIDKILTFISEISKVSTDSELTRELTAYINLSKAKEFAGQERATLNEVLSAGNFGDNVFERFVSLLAKQEESLKAFIDFASVDEKEFFETNFTGTPISEVERIRKALLENSDTESFNIEPSYWFDVATKRIDLLKKIQDYLNDKLTKRAEELLSISKIEIIFNVSLSVVIVVIVFIFSFMITNRLNKEFSGLVKILEKIADGDLTVTTDLKTSTFETKMIADSLKNTVDKISQVLKSVINSTKKVRDSSSTLSDVSKSLKSFADNTGEVSKNVNYNSQNTTASIEEINSGAEEVASTAQTLADNAQVLSQSSNNVVSISSEGKEIMNQIVEIMQQTSEKSKVSANTMNTLSENANKVSEILETINSIAEQTNLLALNAAIEAARAGEAGRGFAVVADEIRKLAEESKQAVGKIGEILRGIQEQVKIANYQTEDIVKIINKAAVNVNDSARKFEQIERDIKNLATLVDSLAASSQEMSAAAQEISGATDTASKSMTEVSQEVETLSEMVKVLINSTVYVDKQVEELEIITNSLVQEVSKFKV